MQNFSWETSTEKVHFGGPGCGSEDNILMYLRETGCVGIKYIQLVKCRVMVGFCEYRLEP
jgi:hypothetical protein